MPKFHKDFHPSSQQINQWFASNGDDTYSLNHRLDENSVVVELGGYITSWAAKFKEDCQIYVVEPVKKFHDALEDKYKGRKKFKTINVGIGTENKILYLPEEK